MNGCCHGHGNAGWHNRREWDERQGRVSGDSNIGLCRCGHGPHAYFQDKEGRVNASWKSYDGEQDLQRIKVLEEEIKSIKDVLGKRISDLEELKENQPKE